MVIRRGLLYMPFFADVLHIGEKRHIKAPFNNNLPKQTNDVMVNPRNPENPDSKPHAATRIIYTQEWV
jgi:hypothetical protein